MRWASIAVLLLTARASAQTLVAPAQVARVLPDFQRHPGDTPLRCEVTPLEPVLNFAFRIEAGYTLHVPLSEYPQPTQGWSVLTTIAPQVGSGQSTFLLARYQPSEATKTIMDFDIPGFYFLGVGRYSVEAAVRDDRNRICRKQWQVVVKPPHGAHGELSALPPDTVRQVSTGSWPDTRHPDHTAPLRLSLLLNAAAFSRSRTAMRPVDRQVLLSVLTGMLEHLPTASVRLVVFSLEQQREVFRRDGFALSALTQVADAIDAMQLATVDFRVLQKPLGHVDFLTGLVNRELQAPDPSDTVVFLGPPSRYENRIPENVLRKPTEAKPRFFYVQYQGPRRAPNPTPVQDGMSAQIDTMNGHGSLSSRSGTDTSNSDSTASTADTPHIPPPPRPPPSTDASNTNGNTNGNTGTGGSGTGSNGGTGGGTGMGGGMRSGRGGAGNMQPPVPAAERQTDIISAAMARLKGKTLAIHSPADLAQAIQKIEGKH
jgi:hypothetical protein